MKITRNSSKPTDEWGTPQWLYDILLAEFPFQLDVCASVVNHKHDKFLTKEDDALSPFSIWSGHNFCNPPYSKILPWYQRWVVERDEYLSETVGPVKYDPSTLHGKFAAEEMDEIRIIEHRITFEGAPNCANFPTAIMVCRPRLFTRKTGARIVYVNYKELIE